MTGTKVWHYEAFSRVPGRGNPAGIVRDAGQLQHCDMQRIAASVGFNETTFILPSQVADVKLKYYTPGHEMVLCGHATVASLYHLKTNGWFAHKDSITVEQGLECGYDGRVKVDVTRSTSEGWPIEVHITGGAVFVREMIV